MVFAANFSEKTRVWGRFFVKLAGISVKLRAPFLQAKIVAAIPGFTDTELWVVRSAVNERCGREIKIDLADTELPLEPSSATLAVCPALYWAERGANFVISKVGANAYRCQFFYSVREQYGAGRETYTDLGDCVQTLLQAQADHARDRGQKEQDR